MNARMFSRTDKTIWGRWWWTIDRPLLAAIAALVIFGVMMVATASPPVAARINLNEYHFIIRHLIVLGPAVMVMIGVSLLSLRNIWRLASIVLLLGIGAMVLVLLIGTETKGAQRWIPVFSFSLQPSEFVKPAFAVVAAWLIAKRKDRPEFPGYWITGGLFFLIVALLLKQPDMGMTIVMFCILLAEVLLAGLPWSFFFMFAGAGILVFICGYFIFDHVSSRVDRFLHPESGDTFQVDRAMEAFRHGGLFGAGPGQGDIKLSIPDAHSDFIFAVAGEEMGFMFLAAIILVLAFITLRSLNRVMDSDNIFIILATGGLLAMFGIQGMVHMASNLHMIPTKGMTLPFMSYGGSSLLSTSFTLGMVLALTRRHPKVSVSKGSLSARPGMVAQL